MKRFLLWTLAVVATVVFQTTILARYVPAAFRPDLAVVVITAVSLAAGSTYSGMYGVACGIITDVLLSTVVGVEAVILFVIALATGFFCRKYYASNVIFAAVAGFLARVAKEVVTVLFLMLFGRDIDFLSVLLPVLLPGAVVTGLLTAPVFWLYRGVSQNRLRRARYE